MRTWDAELGACAPSDEPWQPGDVVGRHYRVRELLGIGGMAAVWEADDVCLRRRVALKITHDAEHSHDLMTHEARALAAIRHPGLPTVHELAVHRRWTFLAMERLYGVSVENRLCHPDHGHHAFDVVEVANVLAAVADALTAIHDAGMAHHDIKPGNVMLCDHERVVLLDLGIMIPEVETTFAVHCGTPRYLAPEAIAGEMKRGGAHLADIYGFGVTAFEMLAGAPPYTAETFVELCTQHLTAPIPDVRDLRDDVPRAFAELITACLAKSPGDRPAAADMIAWQLRGLFRRPRQSSWP